MICFEVVKVGGEFGANRKFQFSLLGSSHHYFQKKRLI
jgi:hypothetical protein